MDPAKWWTLHKNSPGMDGASKRALLDQLKRVKLRDFDRITADMNAEQRVGWDEVFGDDYVKVCVTIAEIEAALATAGR